MNVELTHDLKRKGGGVWTCTNCGKTGDTITEVNLTKCPKIPKDNKRLLSVLTGGKAK